MSRGAVAGESGRALKYQSANDARQLSSSIAHRAGCQAARNLEAVAVILNINRRRRDASSQSARLDARQAVAPALSWREIGIGLIPLGGVPRRRTFR
jgi:hypothetical protein